LITVSHYRKSHIEQHICSAKHRKQLEGEVRRASNQKTIEEAERPRQQPDSELRVLLEEFARRQLSVENVTDMVVTVNLQN